MLRTVLAVISMSVAAMPLAGCVDESQFITLSSARPIDPSLVKTYETLSDDQFVIPAVHIRLIDPNMLRTQVDYPTSQPVGTIIIDTAARHLYLVEEHGEALRYGIGVGRAGLAFTGEAIIGRKAEWPYWIPTPTIIQREPDRYGPYVKGLEGGLSNPLGARAMYLYKNDQDTLFRIHGTNEPETIGHAVSSGCIRLINQDVIDLYRRVPARSRVVVISAENRDQS